MQVSRPLKAAAATALTSVVAAISLAGPMAGSAAAAPPKRTLPPTITSSPASPTSSQSASFGWTSPESDTFTCTVDGAKAVACGSGISGTYSPTTTFGAGTHTFTVRAKLAATGKSKASSASVSWTIDLTRPAAPVVDPLPLFTKNTTANVTWSEAEANTTFRCALDSHALADATSCSQPWSVPRPPATDLNQGPHFVDVYAVDVAGNVSTAGNVSWTVDTLAPSSPVIKITPAGPTSSTSATITWTDGDATSFLCTLDDRDPVSCAKDGWAVSNLGEGTHVVTIQGTDAAGNVGDPGTAHWVVDTTPPPAPAIKSGPAHTTDQLQAVFYFDDADSSANFSCAVDSGSFSPCNSPFSYAVNTMPTQLEPHTFHVKATDQAQNTGPVSDWAWSIDPNVDATPPEITAGPNALTKSTSPSFSFDSLDDAAATFECAVDSGAFSACTSPQPESVATDGPHTFYVRETSSLSGSPVTSDPNSWSWTLDRTPPLAPAFSSAPGAFSNVKTPLFSFTDVEANVTYVCQRDNDPSFACVSPVTTTPLADGAHTFTVAATDPAGNSDPVTSVATNNWTVDTVAPVKPTVTGSDPSGTTATLSLSDVDTDVTSYLCTLDTSSAAPCSSSVTYDALSATQHTVLVQAVDHAGNVSQPQSYTWMVDGTVPSTPTIDGGPNALVSSRTADFTFSMPDGSATRLECWLDNHLTQCTTSGASGGTMHATQATDGEHTFSVVAVNGLGNKSTSLPRNWTVDTTPPPAPSVSGLAETTSTQPSFTFSDGEAAATLTCAVDGTFSSCSSPYTLPSAVALGNHTFVVRATDAAGNSSDSIPFVFHVSPVAPAAPVDTTPPTASVKPTTTLTGISTATFSETVHGLTTGGAALVLTGTTTVVPTTVACLSAGKVVACSGSFTGLRLTPRAALTSGQRYTVRLLAGSVQDAAGNPLTAKSVNFRGSLAEQETSSSVRTTWATGKAKAAYGGSFVRENVAGASATYTFTGTNVTWWTSTGRNQGKATVFIDGVRKAIVNNYATATHFKVGRKFAKLANKRHTIRIVVRGVKGAKAGTGTFVTVDAFSVGKKRVNTPALTTTWHSLAVKQLSAGHATAAAGKGESLSFTFRGTGISWVTERSRNQGKVAVYVDGVRKAVVDNYLATGTKFGVKRTLTGLADKVHTLKLVVLGTHHKGATGTWVTVDRFQVA